MALGLVLNSQAIIPTERSRFGRGAAACEGARRYVPARTIASFAMRRGSSGERMSALGQKQKFETAPVMSVLSPKADMLIFDIDVR